MIKIMNVHIRGIAPTIMHNGQLANPLNRYAKAIKEISSKRKKTESDYQAMAELEWEGSLYTDKQDHPAWTGEAIEGMLLDAAAKLRLKTQLRPSLICNDCSPVVIDGKIRTASSIKGNPKYIDQRGVTVNNARVMRTRPIFHSWELKFAAQFDDQDVNVDQMRQILDIGGRTIGLSDYRPKFGRFDVVSVEFGNGDVAAA